MKLTYVEVEQMLEQKDQRIKDLEAMMEEAVRIFGLYLNTPETRALQELWNQLQKQP